MSYCSLFCLAFTAVAVLGALVVIGRYFFMASEDETMAVGFRYSPSTESNEDS